ncbi:MAG: MFS transporter [Alicyclobacillus sp.]|nr:MFS transporter [Alicyclobacillus sp.]
MRPRSWLFILALCAAALNLRPAITSVAPELDSIQQALNMSPPLASLLTSIPVLCMGAFAPVGVRLAARVGMEPVLTGSVILIVVGTALRFFTHTAWFLLATAFLIGVGIAMASPLLTGFAKQHFPDRISGMISLYTLFIVFGSAAGAGFTVPLDHWLHGSWRAALGAWAVLGPLALIPWYAVLRGVRSKAVRTGETGISLAAADGLAAGRTERQGTGALPLASGRAWLLTVVFGLMSFMFYCFTAWLPPAVQAAGHNQAYAGAIGTVFMLVQIPITLLVPVLIRIQPGKRLWLITFSLFEFAGLALFVASGVSPVWVAALLGIGAGGLFPLALMLPVDYTSSALEASSWTAMEQSFGYLIGACGPFVVGFIRDRWEGFAPAFTFLMMVVAAMIATQLALGPGGGQAPGRQNPHRRPPHPLQAGDAAPDQLPEG